MILLLSPGEVHNNGRSGLCRLVDEAFSAGVPVAVCSTSNEKAVSAIVRVLLGAERAAKIRIFAGDVVPKKKPDPAIYNLAAGELNVDASRYLLCQLEAVLPLTVRFAGICNLYLVQTENLPSDTGGSHILLHSDLTEISNMHASRTSNAQTIGLGSVQTCPPCPLALSDHFRCCV